MKNQRPIPYDPSFKAIGLFWGLSLVLAGMQLVPWLRAPFYWVGAILFCTVSALLFLRRTLWSRHLVLTNDSVIVPSGFLRLRPRRLLLADIQQVRVFWLYWTAVLRVRSSEETVEIQDFYLPDVASFYELTRLFDSHLRTSVSRQKT